MFYIYIFSSDDQDNRWDDSDLIGLGGEVSPVEGDVIGHGSRFMQRHSLDVEFVGCPLFKPFTQYENPAVARLMVQVCQ